MISLCLITSPAMARRTAVNTTENKVVENIESNLSSKGEIKAERNGQFSMVILTFSYM